MGLKVDRFLFIASLAAFVASLGGCLWLIATYAPGLSLAIVFLDAGFLTKVIMMLVGMLGLAVIGLGVTASLARSTAGPIAILLRTMAAATVTFALAGAAYNWLVISIAVRNTGISRLEIVAPSHAEALLVMALGLGVSTLSFLFVLMARRPSA